jgi:signal transduction histidine kinase
MVAVSDEGAGISPEDQRTIFEPFFRVSGWNGVVEGTGLGLSVARRIVKAHGGSLEVESIIDKGSTFRVYLPMASARTEFIRRELDEATNRSAAR